ncbi:MAG: methylenetetrahydrofolate reductase [Caldimonas sp.]
MTSVALAVQQDERQDIVDFMSDFSLETTPNSAAKIASFSECVRPETPVYITFLPGSDFDATIALATRLRREGFEPVPHFAARSIPDRAFLERNLERLRSEADVSRVLLIGGAVPTPVGEFSDSMQLLETGLFDRHGIKKIGLAGHPEGSPDISDEGIRKALKWKNAFAERTDASLYLVTQFCFEAAPIIAWDKRIRAEGNRLPIHIGIPGLATVKTLMAHAKACGVGNSMKFITRQAMNVAKLLTVSSPDKLVAELAAYKAREPACGIASVHMYPLGGLKKSADWSYAVADGRFDWNRNGDGFEVHAST